MLYMVLICIYILIVNFLIHTCFYCFSAAYFIIISNKNTFKNFATENEYVKRIN